MTAWPARVWDSPWLRDLAGPARATLEAAGEVRKVAPGAAVFAPGDVADAFFVVVEGLVDLRGVRRGEATPRVLRRAGPGDVFGEESVIRPGTPRVSEAQSTASALVVRVPAGVYRRERQRGAAGPIDEVTDAEHVFRRRVAVDVLAASSLAALVPAGSLEAMGRAARHVELERGEIVFSPGDPAREVFVVAEGMLAIEDEEGGRTRIVGYVGRGDVAGTDGEGRAPRHGATARASASTWLLALPRASLEALGVLSKLRARQRIASPTVVPEATRHVFGDLWRFADAGSMLVIDDEACVRCGACTWACADTHDDGVSRLVRRGEKVRVRDASDGSLRALIVPVSCQHCRHPACMVDCPTGAIGRRPGGDVFVREELCIGCGQCERACPWGSVTMAPRPSNARHLPIVSASAQVAVKCDLCAGRASGPACVSACPVEAIARVEPRAAMVEVRGAAGAGAGRAGLPKPTATWAVHLAAAVLALVASTLHVHSRSASWGSGLGLGAAILLLAAYPLAKRARWRHRLPGTARQQATLHGVVGILAGGVAVAHAGGRWHANAAGTALLAFACASLSGLVVALAYLLLPRLLARIERQARLSDDLPNLARDLEERTFGALSGHSDGTKAIYASVLAPYAASWMGGLSLIVSARTLREEEAHLRARISAVVGDRVRHVDGLQDLLRLAVERRALRAQRLVQTLLRTCVPLHVVSVAVAVVLVAVHVACVVVFR